MPGFFYFFEGTVLVLYPQKRHLLLSFAFCPSIFLYKFWTVWISKKTFFFFALFPVLTPSHSRRARFYFKPFWWGTLFRKPFFFSYNNNSWAHTRRREGPQGRNISINYTDTTKQGCTFFLYRFQQIYGVSLPLLNSFSSVDLRSEPSFP